MFRCVLQSQLQDDDSDLLHLTISGVRYEVSFFGVYCVVSVLVFFILCWKQYNFQ